MNLHTIAEKQQLINKKRLTGVFEICVI
jgi:hypothetical protein